MAYNGSGVFNISTAGQPVVSGTVISSSVFNALTADLATGLSTCITKDGQTTITANIPMSNFKFTGLGYGTAATDAARVDNCNSLNVCEFRLTGTSGTPITITDVTAIETIYFTPYLGNRIALYDGSKWVMRTSSELSIDVPDATNCYDVFVYDNSGVPALELTAWTDPTTRATIVTTQDGVYVKFGDATRRYVGTFYCTTAGNGQTEDSLANRYIWNCYNRVLRPMRVLEATNSWTYTTSTIRQANGASANQLNYVLGLTGEFVRANIVARAQSSASGTFVGVGVGYDSTTEFTTGNLMPNPTSPNSGVDFPVTAQFSIASGTGKHYLSWNEVSAATGTTTWYGDNGGPTQIQCGIYGEIFG